MNLGQLGHLTYCTNIHPGETWLEVAANLETYVPAIKAAVSPDRPFGVGTVVAFVARFLGRRLAYDYKLVDYEPGARLVMRTQQGPFPMETTYTWEPRGNGTHMTLRNRGTPSGFSSLAAFTMVPAMRRANRKDLAKLKAILEGSEPAPRQER